MTASSKLLRVHPDDNVAVAVEALADVVPAGHKVALVDLPAGAEVIKYGHPIGRLTAAVAAGDHVHSHNLATALDEVPGTFGEVPGTFGTGRARHDVASSDKSRHFAPLFEVPGTFEEVPGTFEGYRRDDGRDGGRVGTRNEIWVLNTVGCVNRAAERIARQASRRLADAPGIDGVHAFPHPFGCSQLGDDLRDTQRILAGLLRHPNAGGVLVLGLGCENNQLDDLLRLAGDPGAGAPPLDRDRLRFFAAQEVEDEVEAGLDAVEALAARMAGDRRVTCPASALVLGLKCGGSDALSGLTANPLVGRVADRLCALGGRAILTEVPEMFGAEQVLMARAVDDGVRREIAAMVARFERYFRDHGQPVSKNPSPGNIDGGLTTLEEKSLGAVQKGGRAPVRQVLGYGEAIGPGAGLALVEAPGNDAVSSTALVAAGATVLLFTTGRGTPLGFPAPTIKIASNSELAARKPRWIDFDAGRLLAGIESAAAAALADELFARVLATASGRPTRNEEADDREIAIWKRGVTL